MATHADPLHKALISFRPSTTYLQEDATCVCFMPQWIFFKDIPESHESARISINTQSVTSLTDLNSEPDNYSQPETALTITN